MVYDEVNCHLFVSQCCSKHTVLRRFREAAVLLVDEISMLSPVLLEVRCASLLLLTANILNTVAASCTAAECHRAEGSSRQQAHGRHAGGVLRGLLSAPASQQEPR